jgi:ankyrin repeat protein
MISSFDADAAVKILNERKLDLSVEIEGETVLFAAVERNLIDVLNAFIKVLLDPGLLCISIARLCQCGAPVNQRVRGSIALHRGVLRGAYDAVNMLLRAGGGLETGASPMGLTALQMAASRGDERMVRMLLDNVRMLVGACVAAWSHHRRTAGCQAKHAERLWPNSVAHCITLGTCGMRCASLAARCHSRCACSDVGSPCSSLRWEWNVQTLSIRQDTRPCTMQQWRPPTPACRI